MSTTNTSVDQHLKTNQTVIRSLTTLEYLKNRKNKIPSVVGVGSTEITFGEDLSALKVAPGDQIKSLNGTYSGDVVSVQTAVGGNPLIVMDTAGTVAFANTDFIVMSGIGSGLYLRR